MEYFKRKLDRCTDKASLISYYDDVVNFLHTLVQTYSYKLLPALFDSVIPIVHIMTAEEAKLKEDLVIQLRNNNLQRSHLHSLRTSLWVIKQEILQPAVYHKFDRVRKWRDVAKLKEFVFYVDKKVVQNEIDKHVENPIVVAALEHLIDDIEAADDPRSAKLNEIVEIYQLGHKMNISDGHRSKMALCVAELREMIASRGDAIELKPINALT